MCGGGQIDKFAVGFVLDEAVDVAVACVVPYMLGDDVHGVGVAGSFVVCKGVSAIVAAATNVATDEADPEILCRSADGTLVIWGLAIETVVVRGEGVVLRVAADGAA